MTLTDGRRWLPEMCRKPTAIAALTLTASLALSPVVEAAEIKVWTARAIATVLAEVGPQFEQATGHKLAITSDLSSPFVRRAKAGEPFDVLITGAGPLDGLIRDGQIVAGTRTNIARSGIGVGVRAGARRPDISTVEAFKRALLEAKSIAYLKGVGSGIHVADVLDHLGIAQAIESKVTRPESDIVSELVAKGEVELGLVVVTQILTTPGVELVGPLPPEIQSFVTFAAGISATSSYPEAARDLVKFLTGPIATPVIRKQGMEAAR
jgi:molybdate transport system substrate-binding protein